MIDTEKAYGIPDGMPHFIETPRDLSGLDAAALTETWLDDRATAPEMVGDDYEEDPTEEVAEHAGAAASAATLERPVARQQDGGEGPGEGRRNILGEQPDVQPYEGTEPPRFASDGGDNKPPEIPDKGYGGEPGDEGDDGEQEGGPEADTGTHRGNVIDPDSIRRALQYGGQRAEPAAEGADKEDPDEVMTVYLRKGVLPYPDAQPTDTGRETADVSDALTGPTVEIPLVPVIAGPEIEPPAALVEETTEIPVLTEAVEETEKTEEAGERPAFTPLPSLKEVAEAPERDGRADQARREWREFVQADDAGFASAYLQAVTGAATVVTFNDARDAALAGAEPPANEVPAAPQEVAPPDPATLDRIPDQRAPGVEFELPPLYDATAYGEPLGVLRVPGVADAAESRVRDVLAGQEVPPEITNFLSVTAATEGMPGLTYDPEMIPPVSTPEEASEAAARRAAANVAAPDFYSGPAMDLDRVVSGIAAVGTEQAYQEPEEVRRAEEERKAAFKKFGAFGGPNVDKGEPWKGIPTQQPDQGDTAPGDAPTPSNNNE